MSPVQEAIIAVFAGVTIVWIVCGFVWLAGQARLERRPGSLAELKQRANASERWYLNPSSDRTTRVWKYISWIAGAAWLIAGYVVRLSPPS